MFSPDSHGVADRAARHIRETEAPGQRFTKSHLIASVKHARRFGCILSAIQRCLHGSLFPGSLLRPRDPVSMLDAARIRIENPEEQLMSHLAMVPKLILGCLLFLSGEPALANSPTNIFDPAATPARSIFSLSMLVLSVTLAIFLIVGGLLVYALIRFRHRDSGSDQEPAQIYGSNQIELSWTIIPILIVVMLFLTTTRVIWETEAAPKPTGAIDVVVIGHQFWWEYRYPKLGVVTANELHIPTSDPMNPTPTYLEMSSADVSHSFWIPRLAG